MGGGRNSERGAIFLGDSPPWGAIFLGDSPRGGEYPRNIAPLLRGGANLLGGESPVTPVVLARMA